MRLSISPLHAELIAPVTVGRWTRTGSYAANDGLAERVRCDSFIVAVRISAMEKLAEPAHATAPGRSATLNTYKRVFG